MNDFRILAWAVALGFAAAAAPASFAQTRTNPADPNSPGAVVMPQDREKGLGKQPSDEQRMRERNYREPNPAGAAGQDPTRAKPSQQNPAAPRPPRSDGY